MRFINRAERRKGNFSIHGLRRCKGKDAFELFSWCARCYLFVIFNIQIEKDLDAILDDVVEDEITHETGQKNIDADKKHAQRH